MKNLYSDQSQMYQCVSARCKKLLNMVVSDFINDFVCDSGLADGFRLVAIYGIIRFCYISEIISRAECDDYFKRLHNVVGNYFVDNICNPYDFSL